MTARTFVIVGASLAGAKAAETLRAEGFAGRIVLVGEERDRPYERPPLSKGYLRGESDRDATYVHDADFYRDHDIELRTSTIATALDAERHTVRLHHDGTVETLPYDRLLLATGAVPRRLGVPGAELPGVHSLRSLGDADRLGAALGAADTVAVIGAGWIGCEVAASARQLGREVVMVAPNVVPLERVLGLEVGGAFRELHREHGVRFRLGTGIEAIRGAGSVEEIELTDGSRVAADVVVAGVGALPRVSLARRAGLAVDDGVVVDAQLRSSHPDVFAAGDVASAMHPVFGRHLRAEHWANALHQGPAAARAMVGIPTVYDRIPSFFSDQYELGMEYSGFATTWDRVVVRGDLGRREFLAFWLAGGVVVAGMHANVWDANESIQRLVRSRVPIDPDRLADPAIPIDALVDSVEPAAGAGHAAA